MEKLYKVQMNSKGMPNFSTAVEVADRPQGEWIPFEYGDERWHKCTACGVADRYIEYVERPNGTTGKLVAIRNFCPNCGARMRPKLQGTHFDSIIIDECAMKGADDESTL